MKQIRTYLFVTLLFFLSALSPITANASAPLNDPSIAPMLKKALPAVVNIKALININDLATLRELQRQYRFKLPNIPLSGTYTSMASGVIVDAGKGYILTNAHVVNNASKITVTLSDGRHYKAKLIGSDRPSDVALLQIKANNLTALPIANSNNLKVGDFVAAIGSPFGLSQSATSGIVSALGRTTLGIENYENFIQTDAPINPGNSGGALVDINGNLVGINTAILAPAAGSIGIGFAIPTSMAKSVMSQLIQYGDVKRGLLGIGSQDITPDLANAFNLKTDKGAAVTQVLSDSPAEKTGIKVGNIIVEINGNNIKSASDVVNTVGFLRVNSNVNIKLIRNDKPLTFAAALTDPKERKESMEKSDPFLYGVGMQDFTLTSPMHGNIKGILVVSVEDDSNAWGADLRPGDVITSVNQQQVTNINDLRAAVAKAKQTVLLNVLRGPMAAFLVIDKEG